MIHRALKFAVKTAACAATVATFTTTVFGADATTASAPGASATSTTARVNAHAGDTVILLHGLGRSPLAMARLEHDLKRDGYIVRNLAYPSQRDDIRTLADAVLGPVFAAPISGTASADPANSAASSSSAAPISSPENEPAPAPRIHIVTHSLGGILLRQYLKDHGTPALLGRVVMLAPPNAGSEVVDHLRKWAIYRRINGPAGLQLGTDANSVPRALGALPASAEVGVIAGNRTLNPFFSAWLPGVDDGKVTVASSHVAGETDHRTMPYSHTWLMWRSPVLSEVRAFLRDGHFTAPEVI